SHHTRSGRRALPFVRPAGGSSNHARRGRKRAGRPIRHFGAGRKSLAWKQTRIGPSGQRILMTNLRIGIPSKGRLAEVAGELLKEAGLSFRRQERTLFARCRELPLDITFLRTEDIPILCAEGAIDMGMTGGDLLAESGTELISRLDLGVGHC